MNPDVDRGAGVRHSLRGADAAAQINAFVKLKMAKCARAETRPAVLYPRRSGRFFVL